MSKKEFHEKQNDVHITHRLNVFKRKCPDIVLREKLSILKIRDVLRNNKDMESIMRVISPEQHEAVVQNMAKKYQKSPEAIRKLLTTEALAEMGYRISDTTPLIEQIERARVRTRENAVIESLRSKGLLED